MVGLAGGTYTKKHKRDSIRLRQAAGTGKLEGDTVNGKARKWGWNGKVRECGCE